MHHIQHQSEHTGGIVYHFLDRKENPTKTRRFIDSDNDREEETVNENVKVNNDTDANQNKAKINMKHLFLMY